MLLMMQMLSVRGRTGLVLIASIAALGCEGRRTVTSAVAPLGLTVRVHVAPDLVAGALALGWSGTTVPGAVVVAEYASDDASPMTVGSTVTNAEGASRFDELSEGIYTVRVSRALTSGEIALANGALGDNDALAGVAMVSLSASSTDTVDVELRGVGGSSLVFSEIFGTEPLLGNGGVYYYGSYFKVYNNADTTIQLADKIFFDATPGSVSGPTYDCTTFAATQRDPAGLWANFVYRFPPSAQALMPGEGALVAVDAIDHRQVKNAAGYFDLSSADFEFKGSNDALNPLAQGMLDVGPRRFVADGHGWRTTGGRQVIGLAQPLDLSPLPLHYYPFLPLSGGLPLIRIPISAVLDVVQWKPFDNNYTAPYPDCPTSVLASVDAAEARALVSFTDTRTMHRRVSRTLPGGRIVLQRSRNSVADWFAATGTPDEVP
jgi:hypothetical protein